MTNRRSITKVSGRLFAALTFLSLVLCACSSDEELTTTTVTPSLSPAPGVPGQLAFNVRTDGYGGETRGTPLNNVTGSCGLIGFQYDSWTDDMNAQEGEENSKSYLMYNEVMQGSGEVWKTSKSYVLDENKKMRFYAYYPYQTNIDAEEGMILFNGGDADTYVAYPYFKYTTPENSSDQKDLMFAISSEVAYEEVQVGDNTEKVLQPIELQFHHLLSAVKLNIKNGFDNGTVKSVTLTGIKKRGEFEYESFLVDQNPKWYIEDETINITQNVEVKVSTKNENELALTNETQYFMILPQEINQSSQLIIVYNNGKQDFTIRSTIGQLLFNYPDPDDPSETIQKPLTFEMGKVITININIISLTKMAVKCTLANWNTGAVFGGNNADQKTIDLGWGLADWEDYTGNDPTNGESTEWEIPTGPAMYTQP